MTAEMNVLMYINGKHASPLHHSEPEILKEQASKLSLDKLILEVLLDCERSESLEENNIREATVGRWRSSLDIWRHVCYYKPDTTIFDVMRELYNLGMKGLLCGQWCPDVRRRVFKNKQYYANAHYCLGNTVSRDEYLLVFDDWKTIGEKINE